MFWVIFYFMCLLHQKSEEDVLEDEPSTLIFSVEHQSQTNFFLTGAVHDISQAYTTRQMHYQAERNQ